MNPVTRWFSKLRFSKLRFRRRRSWKLRFRWPKFMRRRTGAPEAGRPDGRDRQRADPLTGRTRKLRMSRRDKRIKLFGGYPGQNPKIPVETFRPVLGRSERLAEILRGVTTLGPDSVDEATGHPLDNLVNAQGDEWEYRLRQQYLAYRAAAGRYLGGAWAIVEQYRQVHEQDQARLRDTEVAVEAGLAALSGLEPAHPPVLGGRPGRHSPAHEQPAPEPRTEPGQPVDGVVLPAESRSTGWPTALEVLERPRVSRLELRRLLDPQPTGRVPSWADPGFRDGTLLAGRPRATFVHALVLLLAAGADLGAFVQVVELVLPQQDWVIYLVVAGLTAVVLYIAHLIGVILREAHAGVRSAHGLAGLLGVWLGRRFAVFICLVVWLALGLMAFWVRLTVPLAVSVQLGGGGGVGGGGIGSGAAAGSTAGSNHALQGAAIFLGLFLATGVVAAAGGYSTHNPHRGRYVAAIRAYRKASERAAASNYQFAQALGYYEHQRTEAEAAPQILAEAQKQNRAFTEQLKQTVRIKIAGLAADPAVTDAIFDKDQHPYQRPPEDEEPGEPSR
jgi:hypothetical protein